MKNSLPNTAPDECIAELKRRGWELVVSSANNQWKVVTRRMATIQVSMADDRSTVWNIALKKALRADRVRNSE